MREHERIEAIGNVQVAHMSPCGNGDYTVSGFTIGGVDVPAGRGLHLPRGFVPGACVCAIRMGDGWLRFELMEVAHV